MKKLSIKTIVLAALLGALCYVSSYLKIPIGPVPFSAQTATVILASLLLPPVGAFAAQFVHFLLLFLLGGGTWVIAALVGEVIFYLIGIPFMTFVLVGLQGKNIDLQQILGYGLYPFILPDLGKLVVAVFLADRIKAITKKQS